VPSLPCFAAPLPLPLPLRAAGGEAAAQYTAAQLDEARSDEGVIRVYVLLKVRPCLDPCLATI